MSCNNVASPSAPTAYSQDSVERVYQLLLELSPLVDIALPIMQEDQVSPTIKKIKRRMNELNERIGNKRTRIEDHGDQNERDEKEVERLLVENETPPPSDPAPEEPKPIARQSIEHRPDTGSPIEEALIAGPSAAVSKPRPRAKPVRQRVGEPLNIDIGVRYFY